jgi:guanylate kinase
MAPKQLSVRTLKARIKEEKQTSREYRKEGFIKQANQEMQHAKFFEKQLKKK